MKPKIPILVTIPQENDYEGILAIARAYAHSSQILDNHADQNDRIDLFFPSVICAAFALELYLKFFVVFANCQDQTRKCKPHGHSIKVLWSLLTDEHKNAIAGMFRHNSPEPLFTGIEIRRRVFEDALFGIGDEPFKNLRYLYEFKGDLALPVSQAAIWEVLKSVGNAAHYLFDSARNP